MAVQTAGRAAPDTRNYMLGKGHVMFKPDGESSYFHLGNVPSLTITPEVETIEHFSSMAEERVKDDTIISSKSGTIVITTEEATARNLELLLLGTMDEDAYGEITVDLFNRTAITGALLFVATNAKGPRWRLELPKVTLTPSGAFNPISEEINSMEITGSWESDDGDFGTATLRPARGVAAPENVLLPFIVSGSGTSIREGDELEVFHGAWVDASSFTYQWQAASANIVGATEKTYTLTSGEVGDTITCEVTATNSIGTTLAETAATSVVLPP